MKLYDMHCHAGFAPDAATHLAGLDTLGVVSLVASVTPSEYEVLCGVASARPEVTLGLGMHPWWIAQGLCGRDGEDGEDGEKGECNPDAFEAQVARIVKEGNPRVIAEIGLDFSPKWKDSREVQVAALRRVLKTCAQTEMPWVYSIHDVKADGVLLDAVTELLNPELSCVVLHSFNGSCEGLHRAIAQGCYFSVGERFLKSRKGREYLKALPLERVLLETDLPCHAGSAVSPGEVQRSLLTALEVLTEHYGEGTAGVIQKTSEHILAFARS